MEQEKILILNLMDELPQELEIALAESSFEIASNIEDLNERSPVYIFTNSATEVPDSELLSNSRILCFDDRSDISNFLNNQGDVIFDPVFAKSDIGAHMLKRFFSKDTAVQMEAAYEGILQKSFSTKFSNPLTVGYYSDIIAKFAHSEKADLAGLRTFLSSAASFFTYLTKDKVSWFPVDVDYGVTNDAMIIQMIAPVTKVYKDYVIQSLTEDNPANPFVGLMEICTKQSHAIDLYYLEKANKLIITGVWLKENAQNEKTRYSSLLINQLYTFKEQKAARRNTLTSKVRLTQEDMDVNYDHIPGSGIEKFEEEPFEENKNLLSIKKLVDFIVEYRETEDSPKAEKELALRDISRYLRKYPEQDEIKKLEQADREAILKCFHKDGVQDELEETITVVRSSIDKEEFLQTVLDNLTEMDEEDAIHIASSGGDNKEELNRVKGLKEEKEELNKIKGLKEEKEELKKIKSLKEEEEKVIIKSSGDEKPGSMTVKRLQPLEKEDKEISGHQIENTIEKEEGFLSKSGGDIDLGNVREAMRKRNNKEQGEEDTFADWELKKKKITEEVTKKLEELKNGDEDSNIESLEDEIMTVFKNEIGEGAVASTVVKSITDSASDQLVAEKLNSVYEKKVKLEKEKSEQALALRDKQLVRMKKVLDTIKEDNSSLKSRLAEANISNKELLSNGEQGNTKGSIELKTINNELAASKKESDIKDIAIEKLKENQKTAIENKDKQIEQLRQRLENVIDSHGKSGNEDLAVEMKKVSNENRLLQSQLDLKDKTIDNMNKKIEDRSHDINTRNNVELERVKEQNRVALEAMKAFKNEKVQLDGKLRIAQREARQKETELNVAKAKTTGPTSNNSTEVKEKEKQLQAQKVENTKLAEQNKALGIRAKQLEQKMRFLNAQVESANKGNRGGARSSQGPSASGGREAKLALKLKQVETAREKMAMDTQRLSGQLDSKKKEAVSLTTENNLLKNKLADLEQKLNKFEKKAA